MNKYIRLDECCQIALSSIDKKSKSNEKPIKLCNFTDVYYNWNIYSSMTDEFMEATASDKNIDIFSLKQGDVVITKDSETRDDIGMAAFVYEDLPNTVLGYHCALIRPLHSVDGSYLNAFLNSYLGRKHFENQASGSGQRYTLTKEALGSIKIPLIPIHQQKEIGALFSNIDKRIHNGKQTISEFESLAKTIYDYWFLQFEFPNEDGKPYKSSGGKMIWNEELKREIPEGWGVTKVGNITTCLDSKRVPLSSKDRESMKGPYPYYGATSEMDSVNEYLFDGDYVLLAEDGSVMDDNGFPILQRTSGKVWVNNHAHVLQPKEPYGCKLLMFILKNIPVSMIKTGSIQMKVNQENLNAFKVLSIPENIIEKANSILNPIDTKIIMLKQENQKLASLRDFLLPMLMNGQVTFKEEA